MKKHILTIVMLAVMLLAGCGKNETPEIQTIEPVPIDNKETEVTEESGEEERVADTSTIKERYVVDGKMQSYLTGEWKDEDVVKRRNMAVMMPNNKEALPLYGISSASIIYEAPVEGRVSRLMAYFEDYDDLHHIGPVRSSRDYYVYEAMAYDSIYVNWGLAIPFVSELINSSRVDNVSQSLTGIEKGAPEAFERLNRSGYKPEYRGYLLIDGYNDAVERLGYETEYRNTFVQAFTFANDGHPAEYEEHDDATMIYPGGSTSNGSGYGVAKPYFEYNKDDGLYYRYQFGSVMKDEQNGEQVTVSNVIFKVCYGEVREPAKEDYLAFEVHGEGDAYIFTNGKVIKGTWKRANDNSPNMFYDENGEEIIFNQGKTWICNIWQMYESYVSYE